MSPRFAELSGWLAWQEGLHPNVIDLGLERIRKVAGILFADSTPKPFTITVAGTNGKGSCVTALGQLLAACGKRVGSFTSPHLLRYNERIRINGEDASDTLLCEAFAAIDAARGQTSLTYFEFNALAALWVFRQARVDVQVLEVGLGGRLDAVNIVDADIAVITNIALDHTDWLGDTRELIGAEKAGILRPAGKLVYGETDMPASIDTLATALACETRRMGQDFSFTVTGNNWSWQGRGAEGRELSLESDIPSLPLPSIACTLQVLAWMDMWDPLTYASVLPTLSLPGRFERRSIGNRELVFDVAHNAAGAQFLAEKLQATFPEPVDIVFAVMADKDIRSIVTALKPAINHWYLVSLDDNTRAATPAQVAAILEEEGIALAHYSCNSDVKSTLNDALQAGVGRAVLVAGSFFTVAMLKAALLND